MNRNENSSRPREGQQSKQMHYSPNLMGTINNAIIERKILNIEYDSREKGITHRDIEPMAIVYNKGKRNLVGWCSLRNDWRSFRLDRLNCIKLNLSATFNPRPDFKIEDFEILKFCGEGVFGSVYIARHKKTNFICALKKILKSSLLYK